MKKTITSFIYILIIISCMHTQIFLYAKKSKDIPVSRFGTVPSKACPDTQEEPSFVFQFHNEDIVNIINKVSAAKDVNIILPQGGKALKDIKVTFHLDKPVTTERAWELLGTLLDVAGYSIKLQESMFTIVQTTGDISKEPLPTYIGTSVEEIPATDQWIRYVHYFANLQVSSDKDTELAKILETLLPVGSQKLFDALTNAVIIVSKAQDIKAVMHIIDQLDKAGFQEKMDTIKLRHTQARMIADLFKQQILPEEVGQQPNRFRLDARKPTDAYFSPNTRIIADERNNSLIVLGRAQAVDRLRDFIVNYIDVELDSGKSVLHIYKLQYLDAKQVEDVLMRVVETAQSGGTEQSRAAAPGAPPVGGPHRLFDEVVIKADKPEGVEEAGFQGYFGYQQEGEKGNKGPVIKYQYSGGNKLVVAARNSDWQVIKKVIDELDKPQPQVLIEVLIADLTMDDEKAIGTQTRNPDKISLPSGINIQSSQYTNPIVNNIKNPTSIKSDLLRAVTSADEITGLPNGAPSVSVPPITPVGSTIIEFNDNNGSTWSLLQILKTFGQTKIISSPHVISTNNKQALIKLGEERLVTGPADVGNTAANIKNEYIQANLVVKILPRISGPGPEGIVNLTVDIDIEEFQGASDQRLMRTIKTNANVKHGNILALGGLIRNEEDVLLQETPILTRIPILGWFFKNRDNSNIRTNLTVFIRPTVIMPRLRRGVNQYTKDYLGVAKKYLEEGELFDRLQEPITRWFFKSDTPATEIIDEFLKKDEYQKNIGAIEAEANLTPRERRKARKQKQLAAKDKKRDTQELKSLIEDENPLLTKGRTRKTSRAL